MEIKRKKIGLALGSGGMRGLAHIGVIKALEENNIPVDFIAGSSIGAWVGAHYAFYKDVEKLEKDTIGNKREKLGAFLEPTLRGGLIKGDRMIRIFEKYFGNATFSDLKIPLQVVATDLVAMDQIILCEGKIAPAVRASMTFPTLLKPLVVGGKALVDGGISNPVPDDLVKAMGAEVIISVSLDSFNKNEVFKCENLGLTSVAKRTIDTMRFHLAQNCLKNSDIIIKPHIPLFGLKSWTKFFTEEIGEKMIKIGEEETTKKIVEIKKMLG